MIAARVVVETPRPEPCPISWCTIPHMNRRVLTAGEYVLVEDIEDLRPEAWRVLNAASACGYPGGSVALWLDLRAALRGDALAGGSP